MSRCAAWWRWSTPAGGDCPATSTCSTRTPRSAMPRRSFMTAQGSLDWLRERASEEFGMERFRPNLVVRGLRAVGRGRPGRACASVPPNCAVRSRGPRCEIPQVDQVTAQRHREPAKVLRAHRWCTEGTGAERRTSPARGRQRPVRDRVLDRAGRGDGPRRRRGDRCWRRELRSCRCPRR